MFKNNNKRKALALSLALAAMMLTAGNLNAQTSGGLFGKGSQEETDESDKGLFARSSSGIGFHISTEHFDNGGSSGMYHIGTQQFGQDVDEEEAPLGSGLFIMAAAGAAYALKKRKKNN